MSRKLTLLALLVCAAVTGFVLWGLRDDSDARTTHREGVAEPERRPVVQPTPESETKPTAATPELRTKPDRTPETTPAARGETGRLLVKITDATGRPVVGAQIKLIGPDEKGKWTTLRHEHLPADSEINFDSLRAGRVSLLVTRGDLTRSRSVEIAPGRRLEVIVPMPEGAAVKGLVRHIDRGPLPGVVLEATVKGDVFQDTLRTTTDEEGRYTLRNVPPGHHRFKVTGKASGYEQHPRGYFDIPDVGSYERDLVLGRVTLRGVVRDAASGAGIPGVTVLIQRPYYARCTSADDGTYAFRDLAPGTLRLVLTCEGYETRFYRDVEFPANDVKILDLEMVAAAKLHLRIKDDQGRPVVGSVFISVARVGEERSLGTSIQTDPKGEATYERISPGKYVLSFRGNQTEFTRVETTIEPGDNSLDVVLDTVANPDPVSLQGVVRDARTGDPLPGVQVRFSHGSMTESVTDKSGIYRFRGLKPGTYAFFVILDGYGFHTERGVVVNDGEATTRDVALTPAAVLHLHVTRASGQAAVGRLVLVISPLGHDGTRVGTGVKADGRGDATYRRILPGRYKLTVTREGLRSEVETEIRPGENRAEFVLK